MAGHEMKHKADVYSFHHFLAECCSLERLYLTLCKKKSFNKEVTTDKTLSSLLCVKTK